MTTVQVVGDTWGRTRSSQLSLEHPVRMGPGAGLARAFNLLAGLAGSGVPKTGPSAGWPAARR
jgi:hypothetical protein